VPTITRSDRFACETGLSLGAVSQSIWRAPGYSARPNLTKS
jgi:hypothetical protein